MHQAVKELFPKVHLAMGPATDDGFYCDFDPNGEKVTEEDLPKIEARMRDLIKLDLPITKVEIAEKEARDLFKDNPYKLEWIADFAKESKTLTVYWTGKPGEKNSMVDLCRGPHVASTGKVGVIKLLSVAGAYWHGDEKNKMLTRIYGTAFPSQEELDKYLWQIEEAKKRDHRKIGRDLDLFSVDDYVGPGLILWHPKLSIVREEIELYWRREHRKKGYQYIYTPHVGKDNLWKTSGHLEFFKEGMYPPMAMAEKDKADDSAYYVKPMSCPFHVRIYKQRPRSYRELPLRWCELGNVYRYEESGVLHGMLRVRGFTQDDAHVICREDQFVEEVNKILDFALEMNHVFGFDDLKVYLSVRNMTAIDKYVGEPRVWDLSEKTLEEILDKRNIKYQKDIGGAKFYGPAIDLKAVDAMGREWQGTTIQLDMNLPSRFGMTYIDQYGKEIVPIMIHRTLLGAMERFVGTLIEQYAGAFPPWLAPEQVIILPVSDKSMDYAHQCESVLKSVEIRASVDERPERLQAKIRDAEMQKIPYMLIVGPKEAESESVSVRLRGERDKGSMKLDEFVRLIQEDIQTKRQV